MVQLISPNVKVITKDGEVHVSLTIDLNINLNTTGAEVTSKNAATTGKVEEDNDKVEWAIPEFTSTGKVKFGQDAK